jgi:hypothetical protein
MNFDLDADLDPAFHSHADPDPAPHQSDGNLRPLVYSIDPTGLYCELLNLTLMRIRIQLFTLMCIRIRIQTYSLKKNADPDPQPSTCRPKQPCFGPGSGLGLDPDQIQTGKNVP